LRFIISTAICSLIKFKKILNEKYLKIFYGLTLLLFIFSAFNFKNTFYSINSDKHGYVMTTGEHHDKVKDTIKFLENEIQEKDVFIGTIFSSILQCAFNIDKERIYPYKYSDPERFNFVEKVMENNSQGLMILDYRRNGGWAKGYPKSGEFQIGNIFVKTLQNKDGIQVYRWRHDWDNY